MRKQVTKDRHKKCYGQYFSGSKVADLLVSLLPKDALIQSAIDPMAGIGDLLCSLLPRLDGAKEALAIEIDPPIASQCTERLPTCKVVTGDAFLCTDIVSESGWDLVITNPPYIRYQLQNSSEGSMLSRREIRKNLCKQIARLPYLSKKDKSLFLRLSKNYSGLSDMAVPSWILCAALVKIGGLFAIVVPDTWLSREYAAPVQYMLSKCFDILVIAKDVNACWFENALVRTCLVVARRKPTVTFSESGGSTFCLDLEAGVAGKHSLVEKMRFRGKVGFEALSPLLEEKANANGAGYTATSKRTSDLFPYILSESKTAKWLLPEDTCLLSKVAAHPVDILNLLNDVRYSGDFMSLSGLGIACGQGLRTGANEFFYLTISKASPEGYVAKGKPWQDDADNIVVPVQNIIKTVQNRGQVSGLKVFAEELSTGLLYIQNEMRLKDSECCTESAKAQFHILGGTLSDYIDAAERFRNSKGLSFKDYSAVKPNERKLGDLYSRFWYMIPPLAPRHLPSLCMTRINYASPECIFVPQKPSAPIAVDANFVTMWSTEPQAIKIAFALLNSTWAKCYLETLCTVMAGGALKVEATQLRKIQFPAYTKAQLQRLEELGEELIENGVADNSLQKKIDESTLEPFSDLKAVSHRLEMLLRKKTAERGARQ